MNSSCTSETSIARRWATSLAAALLAALALVAGGPGAGQALAGSACNHADSGIDEATAKQLAKAVRCLINEDRADRDLKTLDSDSRLQEVAGKHNRTMLRKNCWKPQCPDEPGLAKRIKRSGYTDGATQWRYAQIFGCHTTPALMVDIWLDQQFPRAQLRDGAYRDIGVVAARDQVGQSECDDGNEATYTVVFGLRKS
jgi:uncharacterized protein YkwD